MFSSPLKHSALPALLVVGVFVTSCRAKEQSGGDVAKSPDTASAAPVVPVDSAKPSTSTAWTNPSITGFAVTANSGEIELGKLAEKMATAPAVKAFAKEMVADHSAMLRDVKGLAASVKATADTTTDDARALASGAHDHMSELSSKTRGKDWDSAYMDMMVADHQKVLDKLQDAAKSATDPAVRSALEKTTPKVQDHLTKAQGIQAKLKT